MPKTETTSAPQEDPNEPAQWAFMRSALSSLLDSLINLIMEAIFSFAELSYAILKMTFIFLFVNLCAFSTLFMGDFIFCNSAHAERFAVTVNIVVSHMTVHGVLFFLAFCLLVSFLKKRRTDLEAIVTMSNRKTQSHATN